MKILRWTIGFIISLFVLLVIAVVLIVNFINPNDYREQINSTISEKIHKPFAIEGDINWVFFPSLGFKAQNMIIGDQKNQPLYVQLDTLEINLQLWPLLHKQIALNALHIDGLKLTLTDDDNAGADKNTTIADPVVAMSALNQLSLKDLSIKNATILKQDSHGKLIWKIKNLKEESSDIGLNHKFPEEVSFDFNYPEKNISAKINYSMDIKINADTQIITLFKPTIVINNEHNSAFPGIFNFTSKKLDVDLSRHNLAVNNFSGDFNQLQFSGDVTLNNILTQPIATGNLILKSDNLREFFKALNISLPPMRSATALTQFSLKTNFQYDNNKSTFNPFVIKVDNTIMTGTANSPDMKNLALNLILSIPTFELSNYLAPSPEAKKITLINSQINLKLLPPPGTDKNWAASTISCLATIKNVHYDTENLNNFLLQLEARNQLFNIIKFHTNLWQGTISANGVANLQGSMPKFSISPQLQNIQIKDLMELLEPKFKASGLANVTGTVSSAGNEMPAIRSNLNGHLSVSVSNGILYGMDANYWLKSAEATLHKQVAPEKPVNPKTDFGNLTATLTINNGLVSNQDLLIKGPVANVKGQGSIDLGHESLNYHLLLAKTNEATGEAHNDIIPLIITGSFDDPSIKLDMLALTKQIVSKQFDKQKDKLLQKALGSDLAKSPVGQQLGNALGRLLGQ